MSVSVFPRLSLVHAPKFLNSHENGCAGAPMRASGQSKIVRQIANSAPAPWANRNLHPWSRHLQLGSVHSGVQEPEPFNDVIEVPRPSSNPSLEGILDTHFAHKSLPAMQEKLSATFGTESCLSHIGHGSIPKAAGLV